MEIIKFITTNWIEIVGAILGILYLFYEYKADIKMWATGILMSSFYTVVFIHAAFYAFACINIYYILVGIYGWIKWSVYVDNNQGIKSDGDIGLKHTPTLLILPLVSMCVILFALIFYILNTYTDSNVVIADSFITTLSIVAMWMLAQKYVEQWLLLIIVNIVSVIVYLHQGLFPTSIMYFIYSVVSVFGYLSWKNKIKKTDNEYI